MALNNTAKHFSYKSRAMVEEMIRLLILQIKVFRMITFTICAVFLRHLYIHSRYEMFSDLQICFLGSNQDLSAAVKTHHVVHV